MHFPGILIQHRNDFNTQLEDWETEDYFLLLTEHSIRGLMLLGAPHPKELLSDKGGGGGAVLCLCCFRGGGGGGGVGGSGNSSTGQQSGLVLQVRQFAGVVWWLVCRACRWIDGWRTGAHVPVALGGPECPHSGGASAPARASTTRVCQVNSRLSTVLRRVPYTALDGPRLSTPPFGNSTLDPLTRRIARCRRSGTSCRCS